MKSNSVITEVIKTVILYPSDTKISIRAEYLYYKRYFTMLVIIKDTRYDALIPPVRVIPSISFTIMHMLFSIVVLEDFPLPSPGGGAPTFLMYSSNSTKVLW